MAASETPFNLGDVEHVRKLQRARDLACEAAGSAESARRDVQNRVVDLEHELACAKEELTLAKRHEAVVKELADAMHEETIDLH